jgi:hypothetical protein
MMQVESAELTAMKDARADALRLLEDVKARIEQEAGNNEVMAAAARETLLTLQEAVERLSTWCPALFGPAAPQFDETCTCWRCSYDQPFSDPFGDPFEGRDEPG